MEARHGAKEIDAGDALDRWIDCRQCVDQADRDIISVDIVTLDGRFPLWAADSPRNQPRRMS